MNDLLYDELDANHHKYFCVTNGDTLAIEVIEQDHNKLLTTVNLNNVCQMVLQNKKLNLEFYVNEYSTNVSFTLTFELVRKRKS